MDDMVAYVGRGYNMEFEDPLAEVQNFYRLLAASEEKVYDGTRCDHVVGCDSSYDIQIKVQFHESVLQ
jgi:hypothetical protein